MPIPLLRLDYQLVMNIRHPKVGFDRCNKLGYLGLSEAFWRISTRPLRASRS